MLGFRYFGSSNEEVGGELVEQKQILQNFRRFRHFERDSPEKRKNLSQNQLSISNYEHELNKVSVGMLLISSVPR